MPDPSHNQSDDQIVNSSTELSALHLPKDGAKLFTPDLFEGLRRPVVSKKFRNKIPREKIEELFQKLDAQEFNPQQRKIVEHSQGPLVVLAGAGSGKTHVVTHRMAHLVASGVKPGRILAVTFTNKAAREMKERVRKILSPYTEGLPTLCTLHSLGFKILKEWGEHLRYKRTVRIVPDMFAINLLQQAVDELSPPLQSELGGDPVSSLRERISGWKNKGLSPTEVLKQHEPYAGAYRTYQQLLVEMGFADFDDLIRLPVVLLRDLPVGAEILTKLQGRFDYIIVDEYQDTNSCQEELLRLLASSHRNICVVGDDDQAIYGWRGADVSIIRGFGTRWSGAEAIALESNYRSTEEILRIANNVILSSKEERQAKVLRAVKPGGKIPELYAFGRNSEEAEWIAHYIHAEITSGKRGAGDFAILVRDQHRSKVDRIQNALSELGVPWEHWFTDDSELGPTKRNAYSLLSCIHAPDEEEPAFMQILKNSRFRISEDDFSLLMKGRNGGENTIWQLMKRGALPGISAASAESINELRDLIERLHARSHARTNREKLSIIARDGFKGLFPLAASEKEWKKYESSSRGRKRKKSKVTDEGEKLEGERISDTEHLQSIIGYVQSFENNPKTKRKTFAAYLNFQLVEIPRRIREGHSKRKANDARTSVTLMTIHGSKGLEFPVVFLPACIEGVIPHERRIEEAKELEDPSLSNYEEEERRLFYVGVTRAKEELILSYSTWNGRKETVPSRYLQDTKLTESTPKHSKK
jgi:DNA helicase-2/ATP-dependent DNA helicase PcrA